jgi:NodT family efflux transporter outer membrane factor (OMF) lipoprotein
VLCAVALAGCAVGPDFAPPGNRLHEIELAPRDAAGANPLSDADVPLEWWTLFNDPVLSELQARARTGNLELQVASERVEQSRAMVGIASSQLLPRVDGNASYAREGLSENGKFAALGAPSRANDFWQLGFDASWEIDLWGRARRAREGATAARDATVYDREAGRVALAAEVARTYLELRGTQAQLDVARQNLTLAERLVGLVESRQRNGIASRFEIASARAQLGTTQATIPELAQHRYALMNALTLLLGDEPRALDSRLSGTMPLPSLPASVPVGLPSELAHRRPDILRAEAQLHAAVAGIGVAEADFYPRIGLRGRVGVEGFEIGDLASWDSRFFSVGPTVYLPMFQGGRLAQRLALSEARQREAAIAYRQTVLRAWHEVANALDALAARQRQHAALVVSYEHSRQALHVAERGYQEGVADYLAVLTAQRDVLTRQTNLNASATSATLALVNLYKSLGGGWDPRELGTASQGEVGP